MKVNSNIFEQNLASPIKYIDLKQQEALSSSKYEDPLMKMPLRLMAYSNDIGVAISGVAPKLGAAFWVPALMYFGADIYDKYKNEIFFFCLIASFISSILRKISLFVERFISVDLYKYE